MSNIVGSRSDLLQSFRVRLATLGLIAVLLLCHGVFGALHLCTASPADSTAQHSLQEHSSQAAGASSHDHKACHLMHASAYYAVLLTALLGLATGILLLFKCVRVWSRITLPPAVFRTIRPAVLHPPRGPTASPTLVLQVMRL
jgi:hypothetical protein